MAETIKNIIVQFEGGNQKVVLAKNLPENVLSNMQEIVSKQDMFNEEDESSSV